MTNHEHCGNQWSLCCDIVERVKKQLDFTKQKVDVTAEDITQRLKEFLEMNVPPFEYKNMKVN